MLPFLEVGDLASSSSFYAAVVQPLGLRYLSPDPGPRRCILYGSKDPDRPVFAVRQCSLDDTAPTRSHIVVAAPSAAAVRQFHAAGVRAGAHSHSIRDGTGAALANSALDDSIDDETSATLCDFDGNIMAVVYVPPSKYSAAYGGPAVRRTQSTDEEATRIVDWNYGVTAASAASPRRTGRSMARYDAIDEPDLEPEPHTLLRRRVTTTTTSSIYDPVPAPPRHGSGGISTGTVIGTLIGAATGAALTYTMIKNDRARAAREEYEPPPFHRRATFPEPFPGERGRGLEAERTVARIGYPGDYPPSASRSHARYYPPHAGQGRLRSRELDDLYMYDGRGSRHHSSHDDQGLPAQRSGSKSRSSSGRARSEAGRDRRPLLIADVEHRSHSGSSSHHDRYQRVGSEADSRLERESYVSARSHRTGTTIRPAAPVVPSVVQSQVVARSRAGSRVATTTIKVSGGVASVSGTPRPVSRSASYAASARHIPLPSSNVGSSHAAWDDDVESLAPSDSISCVGSRRSSRFYR